MVVLIAGIALTYAAGALHHEQRPFIVERAPPLIAHVPDNSFPSDHATVTFACSLLLAPFSAPAAAVAGAVALVVSWGRVASRLHWPVDILCGFLIAALANGIALASVRARGRAEGESAARNGQHRFS